MKSYFFIFLLIITSCNKKSDSIKQEEKLSENFILAFGSCNNQNVPNTMWKEILKNNPDMFVWGGDIVYSDTHDMKFMRKNYLQQKNDSAYQNFINLVPVMGTWDDHDYGKNDGGVEYDKKDSVQQIFLDFFDIDSLDKRRQQPGVYHSKKIDIGENSIKIIILDSRYFRSKLTTDPSGAKRYIPNNYGKGTILGDKQWKWIENELENSRSDFNIIISSIQFLSFEHGFESWGNMTHEVDKLKNIISKSNAKGVIILSGDRHIAEISKDSLFGMTYPLIDFTSSGLTHSYTSFKSEPNPYRISDVIADKNFGILHFDFDKNEVKMEIRGENNLLLASYSQKY